MKKIALLGIGIALALVACTGSTEPNAVPDEPEAFAGTKWELLTLYGTQAIPGTSITLEFLDDRLVGFAGCNGYGALYTATTLGSFEALEVARTAEGCLEPEGVLVQEGVFKQALLAAVRFERSPATLTFFDEIGNSVLQFVTPQIAVKPTDVPDPVASKHWVEAVDDRTGLRFAVPCYWEVEIPSGEQDPSGLGSIYLQNYDMAFVQAHPRGAISEDEGAIKIDISYIAPSKLGLSSGADLDDFAQTLAGPEGESGIIAMEPVSVNGHDALSITQESVFGLGYFTVIALEKDLYALISGPIESDDFQGVLHSIAYALDASVVIPTFDPSDPPLGVEARCMGKQTESSAEDLAGTLVCDSAPQASAEGIACQVQAALLARDMQSLQSYMADVFAIGYWGSEGGWTSPADMVRELSNLRLPEDTSGLTFTTDRSLFPPLAGSPPEQMFGPDLDPALLVYSEGWGPDGLGSGILYIIEDDSGAYYWSNLAYSHKHFDR